MQESVLSPPPLHSAPVIDIGNRISHSLLLLLLVILAVIFFVSGLFHLLVRCCLMRPIAREPEEHRDDVTALQGQLQQLFHLHDAGVDQSFIDMLPVFLYKAIGGRLKDPFDCAVCLCEFAPEDKLRLLPKCSHAFHLECIDTWLLSNSTCPLCRSSLLNGCCSPRNPMVLVLESASDTASGRRESARVDEDGDGDDDEASAPVEAAAKEAVAVTVAVKLGKFKSAEAAGEEATSSTADASNSSQRRCFSMGSYEYVMEDDDTMLQVSIEPPKKPLVMKSGHRITMSECDCHSRREGLRGLDRAIASQDGNVSAITSGGLHWKESLSASKIWLQAKEKSDTSRRAISFRLPLNWAMSDRLKLKGSNASPAAATASEFNVSSWGKSSSEVDLDVEVGSSNYSVGSRVDEAPSFTRRTLLWLLRRQNRAENHL